MVGLIGFLVVFPWPWLSNPAVRIGAAAVFLLAIILDRSVKSRSEWRTWAILACGSIIATFFRLASIK